MYFSSFLRYNINGVILKKTIIKNPVNNGFGVSPNSPPRLPPKPSVSKAANFSANFFWTERYIETIVAHKNEVIDVPNKKDLFDLAILLRINPEISPITNEIRDIKTNRVVNEVNPKKEADKVKPPLSKSNITIEIIIVIVYSTQLVFGIVCGGILEVEGW